MILAQGNQKKIQSERLALENSKRQPDTQNQPGMSIVTTTTNDRLREYGREWEYLQWGAGWLKYLWSQ